MRSGGQDATELTDDVTRHFRISKWLEGEREKPNMKIGKEQWQNWASAFADREAGDFMNNVPLTMEQSIILKVKLESAALYGMEIAATMDARGCDLSEAKDLKPALMRLASNI